MVSVGSRETDTYISSSQLSKCQNHANCWNDCIFFFYKSLFFNIKKNSNVLILEILQKN